MFAKKYSIWFMIYQTVSSYLIFYFRYPPSWGKSTLSSFYGWGKFAPFFSPFFVHKKGCLCPGGGGHLNPHLRLNQWLPGGRCLPSLDFDLIPNLQFWLQSKPPILTSIQTSNFYPNPNLQDPPDVVITVCNRASETCPRFPVKTQVSEILREKTCS